VEADLLSRARRWRRSSGTRRGPTTTVRFAAAVYAYYHPCEAEGGAGLVHLRGGASLNPGVVAAALGREPWEGARGRAPVGQTPARAVGVTDQLAPSSSSNQDRPADKVFTSSGG